MKRLSVAFVTVLSMLCIGGGVSAKGPAHTRGYAVLTGPGLRHPIVIVAPWKKSNGGYCGSEAERFLAFAEGTGALPAGRVQNDVGGEYEPSGVLPIDKVPWKAARGPRYRLTWFRDDVKEVAKQDIYPYGVGGPYVYNFPSSHQALIVLFGRFQSPAHLWTGWGQATSFDLQKFLQFYGLPVIAPTSQASHESDPPRSVRPDVSVTIPTAGIVPVSSSGSLSLSLPVILGLLVFVTIAVSIRRRSRERDHPVSGVGR